MGSNKVGQRPVSSRHARLCWLLQISHVFPASLCFAMWHVDASCGACTLRSPAAVADAPLLQCAGVRSAKTADTSPRRHLLDRVALL